MKRLDKFILKAFIGPFVAVLLVVVFILVMQFLWVYIDELVGKGLGLKVIGEFLMWATFTHLASGPSSGDAPVIYDGDGADD